MILNEFHRPVLLPETLELLKVKKGAVYIDATVGGGGYAQEIIRMGGMVIGLDRDNRALEFTRKRIGQGIRLFQANYADMKLVAQKASLEKVHGVIFDLGLSSFQLDRSGRGFSYRRDEPLDMRFDEDYGITAADILNEYTAARLYEIFTKNSEELNSRAIAGAVVRARSVKRRLGTTFELNEAVKSAFKNRPMENINKTLSRIYQALRIEVNSELDNLKQGLVEAVGLLVPGGRLVVISYHSLEDRVVKILFNRLAAENKILVLTRRPRVASENEMNLNSRSKSAKLRAAEIL